MKSLLSRQWCEPVPDWSRYLPACCGSRWRREASCNWGPGSPISGICKWSMWGSPPGWGHTPSGEEEAGWLEGSAPSGWRQNTCWSHHPSSQGCWACLHKEKERGQKTMRWWGRKQVTKKSCYFFFFLLHTVYLQYRCLWQCVLGSICRFKVKLSVYSLNKLLLSLQTFLCRVFCTTSAACFFWIRHGKTNLNGVS